MLCDQEVNLKFGIQERDKYGRLLAYVYLKDGTMINELLLEKGLARVAVFPPNTEFVDEFHDIESQAKKENKGIWNQ